MQVYWQNLHFKIRVILYSTYLFLPPFKHFLTEEGSQIIQIRFKVEIILLTVDECQVLSYSQFTCTGGPRISWFLVLKGNHEKWGSWIPRTVFNIKLQNGSIQIQKSTFWAFFSWNFDFFHYLDGISNAYWISCNCHI